MNRIELLFRLNLSKLFSCFFLARRAQLANIRLTFSCLCDLNEFGENENENFVFIFVFALLALKAQKFGPHFSHNQTAQIKLNLQLRKRVEIKQVKSACVFGQVKSVPGQVGFLPAAAAATKKKSFACATIASANITRECVSQSIIHSIG